MLDMKMLCVKLPTSSVLIAISTSGVNFFDSAKGFGRTISLSFSF